MVLQIECFNCVLALRTSSRHSEDQISLNRKRAVAILYQLCFGLSQKFNFLPDDNGVETQRLWGTSCSSKVLSRYCANNGKEHTTVVNDYYFIQVFLSLRIAQSSVNIKQC